MVVWFATGNMHKRDELAFVLSGGMANTGFDLKIPSEAGIAFDPEETGTSFLENALIKARSLHSRLNTGEGNASWREGDAIIADDSGLCVDALGGRPGIHSARYCGPGKSGRPLAAAEKNSLLLGELGDNPLRRARFACAMVLLYSPDRFFAAQETLEGEIVRGEAEARGEGGFGYDPILWIPELGRTVAELSEEEKNRISHRGKAGRVISLILSGG